MSITDRILSATFFHRSRDIYIHVHMMFSLQLYMLRDPAILGDCGSPNKPQPLEVC